MAINNCSLTINYCGILTLEIIGFFTAVIYHGKLPRYFYNIGSKLPQYLNPRKSRVFTAVINHGKLPHYFYNIVPTAQCYKTFYRSNLPPFHGNSVILCYKAILPWQLPWNGTKLPWYM